jgi:flagellar biosynthetic protein FlhB
VASSDRSQKTEKPTPRRLKEAREKGQVAKSPELVSWIGLLVVSALLQATVRSGSTRMVDMLHRMGREISDPSQPKAMAFFGDALKSAAIVVAPIVLGSMLIAIVVNIAQVGKPAWKRLKPDFGRLNVGRGLKRVVSPAAWWELLKALVKVAVLFAVAWPTATGLAHSLSSNGGSLFTIAGTVATTTLHLLRVIGSVGLTIAAADYMVQRRRVRRDLMMTKHEVLEEFKQHEGDPRLRQAIRARQQAISRNRMIRMVATADVVVVNPTHYAVALRYDSAKGAPEVVAKGTDHVAARIRLEATRNAVPIVHEPALTRALYKVCDVGALIPVEFYEAVAHLLAFIFRLRQRGRADGYHEFGRSLVEA